jgi:hypothetical protein
MKTLVITLAVLTASFSSLPAKDATFISAIIADGGDAVHIHLSSKQWMKITNFTQVPRADGESFNLAGIAVFKGDAAIWVAFATDPRNHSPHEDVFVAGPATVVIMPPTKDDAHMGKSDVFVTYERGSD